MNQESAVEWLKRALEVSGTQVPDVFYDIALNIENDLKISNYNKGRRDYIGLLKNVVEKKTFAVGRFY